MGMWDSKPTRQRKDNRSEDALRGGGGTVCNGVYGAYQRWEVLLDHLKQYSRVALRALMGQRSASLGP